MKDIKDYLHLYLGQECLFLGKNWTIRAVDNKTVGHVLLIGCSDTNWIDSGSFKLLLRPLSDMTEEEAQEYLNKQFPEKRYIDVAIESSSICYRQYKVQNHYMDFDRIPRNLNSESVTYLLSKGFDLFGLIEAGLAIDKTTLKQEA